MIKSALAAIITPTTELSDIYTPGESLGGSSATFATLLNPIIYNILVVSGLITFIVIIYAGFKYISASGDKDKITQAAKTLNYALIGLILIVAAFLLTNIVGKIVGFGTFFKP